MDREIIKREDIVRESEPILYFDVDGLTKACKNLNADKYDLITIKHCDSIIANMHDVYLTQSGRDVDESTKIVLHSCNPPIEVPIEIVAAENMYS